MSATTYTINNVLNALIRGQAFTAPAGIYVSLHTADPGLTGANEVTVQAWPSYVRRDSLQGDTFANAWAAPDGAGTVWNQKQMIFPVFDSGTPVTITHFALFDAEAVGTGNCLASGALTTPREIGQSQVFVADTDKLGVQLS